MAPPPPVAADRPRRPSRPRDRGTGANTKPPRSQLLANASSLIAVIGGGQRASAISERPTVSFLSSTPNGWSPLHHHQPPCGRNLRLQAADLQDEAAAWCATTVFGDLPGMDERNTVGLKTGAWTACGPTTAMRKGLQQPQPSLAVPRCCLSASTHNRVLAPGSGSIHHQRQKAASAPSSKRSPEPAAADQVRTTTAACWIGGSPNGT